MTFKEHEKLFLDYKSKFYYNFEDSSHSSYEFISKSTHFNRRVRFDYNQKMVVYDYLHEITNLNGIEGELLDYFKEVEELNNR